MYQKQSFKKIEFENCVLKSAKNWPEFQIYQSKIVPDLQIRTNYYSHHIMKYFKFDENSSETRV